MAVESDFFAYGSRWVRADFHLHTRRDREFRDTGEERDFVLRYVTALKQAEIRIGVIANHNKFDCDEYLALRKAARKEDIYLLPGLELSVKDGASGIHTLVVFHEDWIMNQEQVDYIDNFLNVTFAGQANYDNINARSNHDLLESIRTLDGFNRDYFLIFAHVEEVNGLWGGLSGGRITELGNNELFTSKTLGFQKIRTRDLRQKVKGWLGNWYPSEVEGSDPKAVEEVGRGERVFLKVGAFTFEAVQFALKPAAERVIVNEVSRHVHSHIHSIRFEGGMLDGQRINFSDQMNCLIGIRGSGKSAVLETLRYALEIPCDESVTDWKYKQELVRFVLGSGGKVLLEAEDSQGRRFEIRRILNERADVYFDGQLRPGVRITETVLNRPLFFGQKELASKGEGFERDLVEKLVGGLLDGVRREIAAQRQKVLNVLSSIDRLKDLESLEQEYLGKRKDAEFRLELFRTLGVEEKLRRQVEFNADVTHVRRGVDTAEAFVRNMETFLNEQELELSSLPKLVSKENADLFVEFNDIFQRIKSVPSQMKEALTGTKSDLNALRDKLRDLERRREILKDEFAAVERQLTEKLRETRDVTIRPDDFVRLNGELQKSKLALDEIAKSKTRKASLHDELLKELKRLSDLWHKEFKQIEVEIGKLNESQKALNIKAEYKGDKDAFLRQLQDHFRGSRLREATLSNVVQQHADFIAIFEAMDAIWSGMGTSGESFRQYFNNAKSTLLTWQVPNRFTIFYHGKELREHSLGQRASALMLFILSQHDNDLIVVDQPEDDLDNQTIFEDVIKLVRFLKYNIQFIFATHNANFPVLGDAEQVASCSLTGGRVHVQIGSIDKPVIQHSIISIMEGGREAFDRRKEIYQLWKQ
jgi:chromosome segregation protein